MSAATVWVGLEERFRTIDGLLGGVHLGEPTAIEQTPLLYAAYDNVDQVMRSTAPARNMDGLTHVFAVRLVFDQHANPQAEMQLLTLADSVPSAINDDPRLGGRLYGGVASSNRAVSGWANIAKKSLPGAGVQRYGCREKAGHMSDEPILYKVRRSPRAS
jgi:hypothetical protein